MFDVIKQFIVDNWSLCVVVIVFVFNLIVTIFGTGKLNVQALVAFLQELPTLIKEAEATHLSGKQKFTFVFSRSVVFLSKLLGLSEDKVRSRYSIYISDMIENILSTPQKKKGE